MPPKGQGRVLQEKNIAQTVVGELTAPENRQVLTAVGLFVVSLLSFSLCVWDGALLEMASIKTFSPLMALSSWVAFEDERKGSHRILDDIVRRAHQRCINANSWTL